MSSLSSHTPMPESMVTDSEDSYPNVPRIFALVITVDKYKDPNFSNLFGCKNDGTRFIQYLTDVLRVPRSRIVFLADEQATEQAIFAEFDRFLLRNADIQRDDPIVFFFAGHGRLLPAPEGWVTESGKIEALCPHDIQTIGDDGKVLWGIPDRTIDAKLRELAHEKGDNIITIFDCCFSGGLSRGEPETLRARALPECTLAPPANLHRNMLGFSRAAKTVVQSGFQYKAMESHVLLAACRPDERAMEDSSAKDGPGGLFTTALVESLRHHSIHNTSYAALFDTLDLGGKQRPQCEGTNKNRLLFSVNTLRDGRPTFTVYRRDERLFVSAGSIHGITGDTVFTVESKSDKFVLRAIKVRPFGTRIENTKQIGAATEGARAHVSLSPALRAYLHPSFDLVHLVRVTVAPEEAYADVALRRIGVGSPARWELKRLDPLLSMHPQRLTQFEAVHRLVPDVLDVVAHFHACLYRQGDVAASAFSGQIKTRLSRLEKVNGEYGPVSEDLLQEPVSKGGVDIRMAEITDLYEDYCLTFENYSEVDLYLYLFYLDPSDYSIQTWYYPQGQTTSVLLAASKDGKPSVFPFGYGGFGTDPIQFYLLDGQNNDSVFVKAFFTTAYVDLAYLPQVSILTPEGIEACERRSRWFDGGMQNTWTSQTLAFICKKM